MSVSMQPRSPRRGRTVWKAKDAGSLEGRSSLAIPRAASMVAEVRCHQYVCGRTRSGGPMRAATLTPATPLWLLLTCQAVVYEVMFLPKPEDRLVCGSDGTHGVFRHLLKVLSALLTAEEGANVPPDALQHCLWVPLETCSDRGDTHRQPCGVRPRVSAGTPGSGGQGA